MGKVIEYQFLDYRISTARQVLYHQQEQQVINTKAYYLLLTLVKSHGEILSKDELIEAVWPNQIVTDAALSKQILRLRKLIDDEDTQNPIIETHRGTGYRFSVPVKVNEQFNHLAEEKSKAGQKKKILLVFGLLFTLLAAFYLNSEKPESSMQNMGVHLMVFPGEINSSTMTEGHLKYLVALLENKSSVIAEYPEKNWLKSSNPEELAIELLNQGQAQYASLIHVFTMENKLQADISVRNKNSKIASISIEADEMVELLKQSATWINDVLLPNGGIQAKNPTLDIGFSNDSYALQSYLLGKTELNLGINQDKAKEYFEAAVLKDPSFIQAWYELANLKVNMSDFDGAIGIINTQLPIAVAKNDKDMQFGFYYLEAFANYKMQRLEKSKHNLQKALSLVKENNSPMEQIKAFRSLVFLAYVSQDYDLAEQYTEEQIKLTEDHFPLDAQLGHLFSLKAEINLAQYNFLQARESLNQSIHHWSKNPNPENMVINYGTLNKVNLAESKYTQGIQVASEAAPFLKQSQNEQIKFNFYFSTSMIFNLRGLFDESNIYITAMTEYANESGDKFFYLGAQMLKLHALYVQNKLAEALNYAEAIRGVIERDFLLEETAIYYSWMMLVVSRVESPQLAIKKMNEMEARFPALFTSHGNDMQRAKAHIQVRSGQVASGIELLLQVEEEYRGLGEQHVANYVAFEVLEIMLAHSQPGHQAVINRIDQHTSYDYLLYKLKAQFKAQEGDFLAAVTLMQENKLKANQLWSAKDQLKLESYQYNLNQ